MAARLSQFHVSLQGDSDEWTSPSGAARAAFGNHPTAADPQIVADEVVAAGADGVFIEGTGPLMVHFDASSTLNLDPLDRIAGDLVNADFFWEFGNDRDGDGEADTARGWLATQVFDAPIDPDVDRVIYNGTLTVTSAAGLSNSRDFFVTVFASDAHILYVAAGGSDAADGLTPDTALASPEEAVRRSAGVAGDLSILMRRGDTFDLAQPLVLTNPAGNRLNLSDFGSASSAAPVLRAVGDASSQPDYLIEIGSSGGAVVQNISVSDLTLLGINTSAAGDAVRNIQETGNGLRVNTASNILLRNLTLTGFGTVGIGVQGSPAEQIGIFDSTFDAAAANGIFVDGGNALEIENGIATLQDGRSSDQVSVVGSTFVNLNGFRDDGISDLAEFGIRVEDGGRVVVADNFFRLFKSKTAITLRDSLDAGVIVGNESNLALSASRTKTQGVDLVPYVEGEGPQKGDLLFDSNLIYLTQELQTDGFPSGATGIEAGAARVAVRNNIIDNARKAITVGGDDGAPFIEVPRSSLDAQGRINVADLPQEVSRTIAEVAVVANNTVIARADPAGDAFNPVQLINVNPAARPAGGSSTLSITGNVIAQQAPGQLAGERDETILAARADGFSRIGRSANLFDSNEASAVFLSTFPAAPAQTLAADPAATIDPADYDVTATASGPLPLFGFGSPARDFTGALRLHRTTPGAFDNAANLDGRGGVGAADVDRFFDLRETQDPRADLNGDGVVDDDDLNLVLDRTPRAGAGDANLDGVINLADFALLAGNFGTSPLRASPLTGDLNGDGQVNLADFGLLAAGFGSAGQR